MKKPLKKMNLKLNNFLSPEHCHCGASDKSARKIFEHIAATICSCLVDANQDDIFLALLEREQLGSTTIGSGVAIPHCRSAHAESLIGCLMTLENPVNLYAQDEQDVDIVFAIIVPEESCDEHAQTLEELAQFFYQPALLKRLRDSKNSNELYQTVLQYQDTREAV